MSAKKKSKKKKWIIIGIILILLSILAAAFFMRPARTTYKSAKAEIGDITTYYSFTGNIDTKNRQSVLSEKMMQVSEVLVKEGDIVKEGDVLVKTSTGDEIKAKISGEIVNLNVEENAQLMAGIKLMDIVDYDNLEISVKVDEYDLSALDVGKETTVKIGAVNKEVTGKIASLSKEGQVMNGVTYFIAKIDIPQDGSLRVGMTAEVKLIKDSAKSVVTLPMDAIQFDDNNTPYVYKMGEKNMVVRADITTGINDGTTVEIKSGVSDGELVYYGATESFGFVRVGRNSARGGTTNG